MFVEGFKRYMKFNRGIREVLEDLMDSVTLKHQELILYLFFVFKYYFFDKCALQNYLSKFDFALS